MDHYMIRQELNPETCRLEIKRVAGTSPGVPGDIQGSYEELRWMEPHMSSPSPCTRFKKGRGQKEEKREVLHLFRCYTHTRPEPGQPWKARGRKKRTHEGQKAKNSAGGGGTDGPPEPTYTAKRTWPKQRTHLNPTTHYGEARGEIRDQMGD